MFLYIISFLLVFASSYFLVSMVAPKKTSLGFIYLLIFAFAQVVLTFELLSLVNGIKPLAVFALNLMIADLAWYVWLKKFKTPWTLNLSGFKKKINHSFKLDKSLFLLYIAWCIFILTALFLSIFLPTTSADASGYHVVRSVFWVMQGNLNHFQISDIRALCLPINSEILYAWVLLFLKKDILLGCFGFVGYLLSMFSLYGLMGLLGFSTRRKLWVVLILSSFASVLVQASGTETDIIISALISSSILLFWYALKTDEKIPVFVSALAYALAIGTKTTAILAIPGVCFFMIALCAHYKKFKPFASFLGFGLINFFIFSSYNYILNFLDFSNFVTTDYLSAVSKNYYGIRGMFANFIKHIFLFFDFTGLTWSLYFGPTIANTKALILNSIGLGDIPDGLYTHSFTNKINNYLLEPLMGTGLLGILLYFPCLIISLLRPLFKLSLIKPRFIAGFACMFFINLLVLSYFVSYMTYNVRFMMMLIVVSAPVIGYSYFKRNNLLKGFVVFVAIFYLVFVSTNLWPRQATKIVKLMTIKNENLSQIYNRALCKDYEPQPLYKDNECALADRIKAQIDKDNKILIFVSAAQDILILKELEFEGYHIDFGNLEQVHKIDFSKYNLVIPTRAAQTITNINQYHYKKASMIFNDNKMYENEYVPVPCLYEFNPRIPAYGTKNLNIAPYTAQCAMTDDFIKANNLRIFGAITFGSVLGSEYSQYKLYENIKNPIKWKR